MMETQPDLVVEYEAFDGENPFDPIKLYGAITDPSQYNENDHGILKAVIRYKTPFLYTATNEPVVLSFALGDDVSVDTIMGLPSIEELELELHLRPHKQHVSHSLERTFSIFNQETVSTIMQNAAQSSQSTTNVPVQKSSTATNIALPPILHSPLNYFVSQKSVLPVESEPDAKRVKFDDSAVAPIPTDVDPIKLE